MLLGGFLAEALPPPLSCPILPTTGPGVGQDGYLLAGAEAVKETNGATEAMQQQLLRRCSNRLNGWNTNLRL